MKVSCATVTLVAALLSGAPARAQEEVPPFGAGQERKPSTEDNPTPVVSLPTPTPPAVLSVSIRRLNVFSPAEAAKAFVPYRLANGLHAVTAEWFVNRELLFRPGDPFDPEVLAETERRLRATRLFRSVSVTDDGVGRVAVETGDAWTLLPRGSLSRKGAEYAWSIGLEERNILGTGRGVSILYDSGYDRISRSLAYVDPQFVWPFTTFELMLSELSDGMTYEAGLARPFFAFAAPWGASGFYRQTRYDTKLYAAGTESTVWNKRERSLRAEGGALTSLSGAAANRTWLVAEWDDVELARGRLGPPPPPDNRRFMWLGIGLERAGLGWIVRRQVEQLDRDEDVNLAPTGRLNLAFSPGGVAGTEGAFRTEAVGSFGTLLASGFATFSAQGEARWQDGVRNVRYQVDARAYRLASPWTVILHAGSAGGWRLDPEFQYYLDPIAGVRGYALHAASGTGRATGNVEARYLFVSDLLSLVSIAGAAFTDAGILWGTPDGMWSLADAGVGIRFGLTRASKNTLIRLDVSRALRKDPQGRGGWLVSFSSGAAF